MKDLAGRQVLQSAKSPPPPRPVTLLARSTSVATLKYASRTSMILTLMRTKPVVWVCVCRGVHGIVLRVRYGKQRTGARVQELRSRCRRKVVHEAGVRGIVFWRVWHASQREGIQILACRRSFLLIGADKIRRVYVCAEP